MIFNLPRIIGSMVKNKIIILIYVDLGARYIFEPIAVETLGVFNASARCLLDDLGWKEDL